MHLWWKYQCFEKGIDPLRAKKIPLKDVQDIMDISNAVNEKTLREVKARELLANMK